MNKYLKKFLVIIAWIIGSVISLFILIFVLIQIPSVQNFVKNKAVSFLENKIGTPVKIEKLSISFPKKIVLENFYFESKEKDTLLYGKRLIVDIGLLKLLKNKVDIQSIELQNVNTHISRNKDSVFNFDYIIKAFVKEQTQVKSNDSTALEFSLGKISLDNIRVKFDDAITRNNLNFGFGHFDAKINKFDFNHQNYDISTLNLDRLNLKLEQGIIEEVAKNTQQIADSISQSPNINLKLGEIALSNININYGNQGTRIQSILNWEQLYIKFNQIDIKNQLIDISNLKFTNSSIKLQLDKNIKPAETKSSSPTSANSNNWKVVLNESAINHLDFKFDNENVRHSKSGIDYMHLSMKDFNLLATDLYYSVDSSSVHISKASLTEKSGLVITKLQSNLIHTKHKTSLTHLLIETPRSIIKNGIELQYPSLTAFSNNLKSVYINADINHSRLAYKDVLLFAPQLRNTKPFSSNPNGIIYVNAKIIGKVNNLNIPYLQLNGLGDSKINLSGNLKGLPDVSKAYFNLKINQFQSTKRDILTFAPKGTIPTTIQLPNAFSIKGNFKGMISNFSTNLVGNTSFGGFKLNVLFNQKIKNRETYVGKILLQNFNLGKLLRQDKTIGKISLVADIKGLGLNPNTATANLNGKILNVAYNGYNYHNLNLNAKINKGSYELKSTITDPNLNFSLLANGNLKKDIPSINLKVNVKNADLGKLNFYKGKLKMAGDIEANFTDLNPDNLNGYALLNKTLLIIDNQKFVLDSVSLFAQSNARFNKIELKSPFMYALINGKFQLTKIATALNKSVSKYYTTTPSVFYPKINQQQFNLHVVLQNHPVITNLVANLKKYETIYIDGNYNSMGDTINLKTIAPKVVYGNNTISGINFNLNTVSTALKYDLNIAEVKNNQILLPKTSLNGDVANNVLQYNLLVRDKKDKERYTLAGNLKASKNTTEIRLNPDGLKLNYQAWNIDNGNLISISNEGLFINQFNLSNQNQAIHIQSSNHANSPLKVDFSNFKIETITSIIEKDSLLVGGTINGTTVLNNLKTSPNFTSDLLIKDFNFKQDTVGNILLKVHSNNSPNIYNANIQINGNGNQANFEGFYKADNSTFDFDLQLQKLNLKSIQGFSLGYISNSSGYLTGNFKITGNTISPNIRGDLQFNNGAFRINPLNSYYQLLNDRIAFNADGIQFDKFSFEDSTNNKLSIDGMIYTQNYKDYRFNLEILADNFKAMNSSAKDNELYYGQLFLDTRIRVKGDLNKPIIDGDIKVNNDSKLTMVLPQSDPGIVDRDGIVEFIDQDFPQVNMEVALPDSLNQSKIKGLEISLNIEIEKEAELNLVIDKGNGDFVKLKGEAKLNATIDPSGKTSLTGRYDLNEGSYEMSFNFIRRKFTIKDGSSIVWTGEPTTADINITAIYVANTAPIDLLDNQLSGLSAGDRNTYKQKLPFNVLLNMNGELLKPILTFDVVLPEGNYNVSEDIISNSRIKLSQIREQPSELNKQVFALLLLNRFIGENPFASEAGSGGVGSLARQSVSKILSQQLNDLAGNLIAGVDLNFDLESTDDYTTGQKANRTDLNVGLSKQLLNDRLKVTIGSSFGLEGPQQSNQQTNNIAGDIAVDYQLSADGRYKLRAYRKNQYQVALQGQVIETGIGFIINMDYNKFREIFILSKKRKKDAVVENK